MAIFISISSKASAKSLLYSLQCWKQALSRLGPLTDTSVNNSKIIGNGSENNQKLAKSNFTKPIHEAKESSFFTLDAR